MRCKGWRGGRYRPPSHSVSSRLGLTPGRFQKVFHSYFGYNDPLFSSLDVISLGSHNVVLFCSSSVEIYSKKVKYGKNTEKIRKIYGKNLVTGIF